MGEAAKESGAVDPDRQVTKEEVQQVQFRNSQTEKGQTSDATKGNCRIHAEPKRRVTARHLLNKWQWEKKMEYDEEQQYIEEERRFMAEHRRYEAEVRRREQEEYR